MGHARGAAAVRLSKMEPEPEVAVAQVMFAEDRVLSLSGSSFFQRSFLTSLINRMVQLRRYLTRCCWVDMAINKAGG